MFNLKCKIMKKFISLLIVVFCLSLMAGCDKTEDFYAEDSLELKSAQPHTVTVPFKADFVGVYDFPSFRFGEDANCEDGYGCRVFVDFKGTATHLGNMYGNFEFCACGPDDPEVEGPDNQYLPSESYMVAANGDTLFVTIAGTVRQGRADDHPDYVLSYFRDPFIILGGTGRFEGASGGGWSDDYNSSLDPNSHHHWRGTITMVKGKRK